jgi:putative (di)nucleoside polyphosphate hydrolase
MIAKKKKPLLENLPYRSGVGAVIFNDDGLVWIGCRLLKPGQDIENYWQMPQGGIDPGEDPELAVIREVEEETGTEKVEIIDQTPNWINYDLPDNLIGIAWGGKFRGQTQKWFALRFTGSDADFNLNNYKKPEFSEWQWTKLAGLPELIVPFKRELYDEIAAVFGHWPKKIRAQNK